MTHIIIRPEKSTAQDVANELGLINLVACNNPVYFKGELLTPGMGIQLYVLIRSRIWVKPGMVIYLPGDELPLYIKRELCWDGISGMDWGEIELRALERML